MTESVKECKTETELLAHVYGGDDCRRLKAIRYYAPKCPACLSAQPDFEAMVKDHPEIDFAAIDVSNVLVPRVTPKVKYVPSILVYKKYSGLIYHQTGTQTERLKEFFKSRTK